MKRPFLMSGQASNLPVIDAPADKVVAMYYVYILYSPAVKKFYIGSTANLQQRIVYHNNGQSPYTRNKGPWLLAYSEPYESKRDALRREWELKNWKSSKRLRETLKLDVDAPGSSGPAPAG